MPNRDGTGPLQAAVGFGRGFGQSRGNGYANRSGNGSGRHGAGCRRRGCGYCAGFGLGSYRYGAQTDKETLTLAKNALEQRLSIIESRLQNQG
ncbi:MAG: DUF5320 domain-containing protein [Sphaerochaetaceae bacterium]|jgi:hypothetical protein